MSDKSIIITKEVLKNEVVSVDFYTLNDVKYGDKKDLLGALADLGVDLTLTVLNLILGNHMVPKNVTSKYPTLKFIDNATGTPTKYYYNE